jgi:outer membrane receptor protein involved in Fe transport
MTSSSRVDALLSCARTGFFASAASGVINFIVCGAAAAQQSSSDQTATLEEILITAQRRSQNLQDVPISALVTSGEQLGLRNNNDLNELTQTVPAVYRPASLRRDETLCNGLHRGARSSVSGV